MNCSYRIIPVHTGDVSGVCSALYELGGMVVIHDPSGCNSTYNTHDETRWYDKESLIFISGLSERDAILGNDNKLIEDIIVAATELRPLFIALTNSPIPFMSGTDFVAIARVIESKTGIPTFFVPANGMHDYTCGAGNAFARLAEYMYPKSCTEKEKDFSIAINILGVTPFEFDAPNAVMIMEQMICEAGFSIVSNFGMGEHTPNWKMASRANVNLVVSSVGLALAKRMEQLFGIPYVVGAPIGSFAKLLFSDVRKAACDGISRVAYRRENLLAEQGQKELRTQVILLGEAVTMESLAYAFFMETQLPCKVICPLETYDGILQEKDTYAIGEEGLEQEFSNCMDGTYLVADPLYKPIVPDYMHVIEFSHEAFSGRCFRKMRKQLVGEDSEILREMKRAVEERSGACQ